MRKLRVTFIRVLDERIQLRRRALRCWNVAPHERPDAACEPTCKLGATTHRSNSYASSRARMSGGKPATKSVVRGAGRRSCDIGNLAWRRGALRRRHGAMWHHVTYGGVSEAADDSSTADSQHDDDSSASLAHGPGVKLARARTQPLAHVVPGILPCGAWPDAATLTHRLRRSAPCTRLMCRRH